MTKYCKDCKHHRSFLGLADGSLDKCASPVYPVNIVTGIRYTKFAATERRRNEEYNCGPEAKLFEQKVTLWQHVKQLMTIS